MKYSPDSYLLVNLYSVIKLLSDGINMKAINKFGPADL